MFILEQLKKKNLQSTLDLLYSPVAKEYIKTTYADTISIDKLDGMLYLWVIAKGNTKSNNYNKELEEKIKELKGKIIRCNPDLVKSIEKESGNYRTDYRTYDLTYHAFKMAEEKNDILLLKLIYNIQSHADVASLYQTKVWSDLPAAVYLAGHHMPKMWELINRELNLRNGQERPALPLALKYNTGHYTGTTRGLAINSISIASITLRQDVDEPEKLREEMLRTIISATESVDCVHNPLVMYALNYLSATENDILKLGPALIPNKHVRFVPREQGLKCLLKVLASHRPKAIVKALDHVTRTRVPREFSNPTSLREILSEAVKENDQGFVNRLSNFVKLDLSNAESNTGYVSEMLSAALRNDSLECLDKVLNLLQPHLAENRCYTKTIVELLPQAINDLQTINNIDSLLFNRLFDSVKPHIDKNPSSYTELILNVLTNVGERGNLAIFDRLFNCVRPHIDKDLSFYHKVMNRVSPEASSRYRTFVLSRLLYCVQPHIGEAAPLSEDGRYDYEDKPYINPIIVKILCKCVKSVEPNDFRAFKELLSWLQDALTDDRSKHRSYIKDIVDVLFTVPKVVNDNNRGYFPAYLDVLLTCLKPHLDVDLDDSLLHVRNIVKALDLYSPESAESAEVKKIVSVLRTVLPKVDKRDVCGICSRLLLSKSNKELSLLGCNHYLHKECLVSKGYIDDKDDNYGVKNLKCPCCKKDVSRIKIRNIKPTIICDPASTLLDKCKNLFRKN